MKQFRFYLLAALVIAYAVFASCQKENPEQSKQDDKEIFQPRLRLVSASNLISGDTSVFTNDTLRFLVEGVSNDTSPVKLSKLEILKKNGAGFQLIFDTLINSTSFGPFMFKQVAPNVAAAELYLFKLIDENQSKVEKYVSVLTLTKGLGNPRPNGTFAFGGFPEPEALPVGSGVWMAGDLHVHTNYSDDASNRPMASVIAAAKQSGLSFLGVTDHDNHVNGDVMGNTWADPSYKSDEQLVVLYGAEWTTAKGHGNTFSDKPYNHMAMYNSRDASIAKLQETVFDLDILLSANHPSGGDPWGYGYDVVRSIEIWNSAIWTTNTDAQTIWNDQLGTGRRMTGIGGSDSHHGYPSSVGDFNPNSYQAPANALGTPTTWVRAKDFSSKSVLEALKAGRVSISATPKAPRLVLEASDRTDGSFNYGMGDNIKTAQTKALKFVVKLENITIQPFIYRVTVIKNGATFSTFVIMPRQNSIAFEDTAEGSGRSYYRVILEGLSPAQLSSPVSVLLSLPMVAISNPVYVNF